MSIIRLGYELGTGAPVDIPGDRHIAVSGQTQLSGKTTTLEALVTRSGKRAVAFVTKRGEGGFRTAHTVAPYFRDRADWQFVKGLLESQAKTRMNFEASWIIDACRTARTLGDVQRNIRERLEGKGEYVETGRGKRTKREWKYTRKPASGLDLSICTVLNAYLDIVLPQIETLPYTTELKLLPGINVMELDGYSPELQALVIRSVLEWVHAHETNTVVIIPEAWKFVPQKRGSPVLFAAETLIREGAGLKNFIWLDSQNMAGVSTDLRAQIGVWILGIQTEAHEIKRTLGITEIASPRPTARDIMTLNRGEFFVCFGRQMHKVYVQPAWISDAHAAAIARGEEKPESVERIWREITPGKAAKQVGHEAHPRATRSAESELAGPVLRAGEAIPASEVLPARLAAPAPALQQVQIQESEGEDMGKLDELEKELAQLRRHAGHTEDCEYKGGGLWDCAPGCPKLGPPTEHRSSNGFTSEPVRPEPRRNGDMPASYTTMQEFKRWLLNDPQILAVLREVPTIELRVARPRINFEGDSQTGRVATLIAAGFFAQPQPLARVFAEFKRRGWMNDNNRSSHLNMPLAKLTEMGFLTNEAAGFQAVPDMKIETHEVRA